MKKIISALLTVALAVSVTSMSACGDKKEEPSAKNSSSTSAQSSEKKSTAASVDPMEVSVDTDKPKITQAQIDELNKKLTDAQAVPTFTSSAEKIVGRDCAKDLTVAVIAENSGNSYHAQLNRNFVRAADRMGVKSIDTPETDGTVSKLNDGLSEAVKKKNSMVFLSGDIPKDTISSYIENAQANGIEVISAGSMGTGQKDSYVDYTVPIPYENAGALMADWGIVKTQGKLNALIVNCTDSALAPTLFRGFKAEFEKYVSAGEGNCTIVSGTSIELGNGLANKIKSALEVDHKINYIFVLDDGAINDAVSATIQAGTDVKIVATGGSSEDMDFAQSGSIEMLVAQSYEWTAYTMLDYALRLSGGAALPEKIDVPFRVLTKDVIKKAIDDYKGDFDGFHEICFGDAFITGYNELWNY